jgi:hypothetical protein
MMSAQALMQEMDPFESKEGFGAFETGIGHMVPQKC